MPDERAAPGDWSTADWHRLDELYASCLDLPPAERLDRIAALRAAEPLLANRLEALLEADLLASRFLEQPAAALLTPELVGDLAGRKVGPYRIERHLGSGGMGTVYLARHEDERLDRQVALKLIRASARGDLEFQRRFERESRILAGLEHPGIARLYDGGTSADGVAYLVMEYVDGVPIDRYCQQQGLSVDEILRLFVEVGEAVAFAHAHLVVHRDLKTGNILVSAAGEPKLLDFGIAASLAAESPLAEAADPETPQPRTPAYAAPEQLQGGAPSPATDVYSLGVVLYRLLTGRLPLSPEGKTLEEHDRAVREITPALPSRAVLAPVDDDLPQERRARARRLAGDLDAILAKALAKSPAARYPTAAALTEDLVRHLEHRPVAARTGTVGYRVGRFCRRFRVQVAAAALIALALAGTAVATTLQARRIAHERDRAVAAQRAAELERDRAERTAALVTDIFEGVDPAVAKGPDALDGVLGAVRRNLLDYRDSGVAKAAALVALAEVHNDLGRADEADELLTASLALTGEAPAGSPGALERNRAWVTQAEILHGRRRGAEAEAVARRAHDDLAALPAPPPGLLALAKNNLALSLLAIDRGPEAERLLAEAVAIAEANPDRTEVSFALSLHNHALVALGRGDLEEARQRFEAALERSRATTGATSAQTASILSVLGSTLVRLERYAEAEAAQREALAILESRLGERHPDVIETLNNLAVGLRQSGRVAEAAALQCEGLARRREVYGERSAQVAQVYQNLSLVLAELGDVELGLELLGRARAISTAIAAPPATHAGLLHAQGLLAGLAGHPRSESRSRVSEALNIALATQGESHPLVADYRASLAWLELESGRPAEARTLAEKAREVFVAKLGTGSPRAAWAELLSAAAVFDQRGEEPARERVVTAFGLLAEKYGHPGNPTVRRAAETLDRLLGGRPWPVAVARWREALAAPKRPILPEGCRSVLIRPPVG